jgi:hypothetical protein
MLTTLLGILTLQLGAPSIAALPQGSLVRVAVAGGPRISGRFLGMVGDSVILHAQTGAVLVHPLAIDSIWTRHRPIASNALRGAWDGAVTGVVIQVISGLRVSCHESSSFLNLPACRLTVGKVGRAAALGGAIGGAGGLVVGVAFPQWKLRFP